MKKNHRLKEFESRVLRKKVGPAKYEITEKWRRLHGSS
jgi:hypothetical protein